MARYVPLDPAKLSTEQRKIFATIASGPRGRVGGPFPVLLHRPEIADRVQALGAALRFDGKLPATLREIAILSVARHWACLAEWNAHVPIGIREGLDHDTIKAIADGQPINPATCEHALVNEFCRELLERHEVSDSLFQRSMDILGIEFVTELVVIVGYYVMLSMTLNAFEVEPEPDHVSVPDGLSLGKAV